MKKITSNPYVVGFLLALPFGCAMLITVIWFPGVVKGVNDHERLVRDVSYTVISFAYWIARLWYLRRRGAFWASILALFLFQMLSVVFYNTQVHPLNFWQWAIVFTAQSAVILFLLEWMMRQLERLSKTRALKS